MAQLAQDRVSCIHSPSPVMHLLQQGHHGGLLTTHMVLHANASWVHMLDQLWQPDSGCLDMQHVLCACAAAVALARCALALAPSRSWSWRRLRCTASGRPWLRTPPSGQQPSTRCMHAWRWAACCHAAAFTDRLHLWAPEKDSGCTPNTLEQSLCELTSNRKPPAAEAATFMHHFLAYSPGETQLGIGLLDSLQGGDCLRAGGRGAEACNSGCSPARAYTCTV